MFGHLDNNEIERLIHQQVVGRIGCNADGITYIVPISYAYDGEYVYARTFEGMKMEIMRKNPNTCFQVDNMTDLANWKSVVCWGTFEELKNEADQQIAIEKLSVRVLPFINSKTMKLSPTWPFSDHEDKVKGIFFRIKLTVKTGRFEKSDQQYFFAT